MGVSERFEKGLAVRRAVLGAEHVDRSLEHASPFSRPMQELVTEYCWGAVWTPRASTAARAAWSTSACSLRSASRTSSAPTCEAP